MMTREAIIEVIRAKMPVPAPISEDANLYTDLGFDSFSFVVLLAQIEEMASITFNITEMDMCLQVGKLIAVVEQKGKERGYD